MKPWDSFKYAAGVNVVMALKHSAHWSFGDLVAFTGNVAEYFLGEQSYDEFYTMSLDENSDQSFEEMVRSYLKDVDYGPEELAGDLVEEPDTFDTEDKESWFDALVSKFEDEIESAVKREMETNTLVFFIDEQQFRFVSQDEMIEYVKDLTAGETEFVLAATSMVDGSHKLWWDREYKMYGSGQNWWDQSDEITVQDPEDIADLIHNRAYLYDPCNVCLKSREPEYFD